MPVDHSPVFEATCSSVGELHEIASSILKHAAGNRIVLFYGPMGSGKTTLIKELCRQLNVADMVSSPTFTLLNEYHSASEGPVYHFDFYRLKTESEAFDFGYEEYFYSGHYCFIEWPEKISTLIPHKAVEVVIDVLPEGRKYAVFRLSGD